MDKELEDLRKKVKEKEEKQKIETEKHKLKDKLDEGSIRSTAKKIGKHIFKKLLQ